MLSSSIKYGVAFSLLIGAAMGWNGLGDGVRKFSELSGRSEGLIILSFAY